MIVSQNSIIGENYDQVYISTAYYRLLKINTYKIENVIHDNLLRC